MADNRITRQIYWQYVSKIGYEKVLKNVKIGMRIIKKIFKNLNMK